MPYKVKFTKKEEAPEEFRELLKETEDKAGFEISLVPTTKLDEFRNRNIEVSTELDKLKPIKAQFETILGKDKDGNVRTFDALNEELTALRTTAQQVADGKLKTSDVIDKELNTRTEAMKSTYEAKLTEAARENAALKAEIAASNAKSKRMILDGQVNTVCMDEKLGVNPHALADVMRRAREVFEVQDDETLVAKENGIVLRGEDGVAAMTPAEWVKGLRKSAPHYFKQSSGGGSNGGGSPEAKFGGMTEEAFNKLSPEKRLAAANRAAQQGR